MVDHLAQYRILERVGAGALGDVYRARDSRVGRTVTIKVLPDSIAADAERLARVRRDARAAAALSHPNIALLYEMGEDQGRVFLAIEFAPGDTLKAAIGGQAMNPRRALDLGVQIADALAEGHAHDVVHRHLTPATVIVTPKGRAKVLDFGLTLEEPVGEAADHRTDILALGALLFEMLTGSAPPSTANRPLAPDIGQVISKLLAKDVDRRYQSAAAVAADLRAIAAELEARRAAGERGR